MKSKLDVLRMIELEKIVESNYDIDSLTVDELMYLDRAKKLPIKFMESLIEVYKRNWLFINEVDLIKTITYLFKCSKEDLRIRINEVHTISRYYNNQLNNILKERKTLIKRINKIYY